MEPERFLDLARELCGRSDPAACRTAISRAYYAVYHVAAEVLRQGLGVRIPEGPGAHGDVAACLVQCGDPEAIWAGHELDRLRSDRVRADYRLDRPGPEKPQNAQLRVERARTAAEVLRRCSGDKERVRAMRQAIEKAAAVKHLLS